MKYIICPLLFGFVYWISGTGIEQKYKVWLKDKWQIPISAVWFYNHPDYFRGIVFYPLWRLAKELVRRKNLMALATFIVLSLFTSLSPWQKMQCSLAIWLIHFCGWWDNIMAMVRGFVEGIAVSVISIFTNANPQLAVLCCIMAFMGGEVLNEFDPHKGKVDWWWVCSGWTGAWVGLGVAFLLK